MDTTTLTNELRIDLFKHELNYTPAQTSKCYFCSNSSNDSSFIFCSTCQKNYHMECVFAREEDQTADYQCPSCLRKNSHLTNDKLITYSPSSITNNHVVPLTVLTNGLTAHEDATSSSCDGCSYNGISTGISNHKQFNYNGAIDRESNSNLYSNDIQHSNRTTHILNNKPKKVKTQSLFDETYDYLEGFERRKRNRDTLTKGDRIPNGGGLHGPEDSSLQCLGPACTNAARDNSKYCCEECGIQLAIERIKQHLPQRLEEWKLGGESLAQKRDRDKLEKVNKDLNIVRARIQQLDVEGQRLNQLITRVSKLQIISNKEKFDNESEDLMLDCPTCGIQFAMKKIQLHMEKCWAKIESSMTLSSYVKLEGANFFCDKYDKKYNTYCKKLKVMCPEHTKEPKIGTMDVCGCPLIENLSILPPNSPSVRFCQLPKRTCRKHPFWEKMRRATIDQEKLIQWLKLDELDEQRKLLRGQLSTRGNLIALLLHRTIPANITSV
ncbi:CXXC-type zinc finger protein 1-like [Oopsacas minuta]|uniref:CXXC-type zinc finger protein 1 n=1 Tax=Oopsacas minuta TaxID=111878 RepID=A0AAV7K1M8_9METZ|nr:CXXC-type zinc finger protein 1-like [Oopsacas minuta]